MAAPFGHGLVLGKFYPPHLGHLHLISEAAAGCDAVTVLVMAARSETLPLAERVAWLRAACAARPGSTGLPGVTVIGVTCDAPVDYGDPVIWTAQMAVIRAALDRDRRPPVDAVFTGERYGGELAGRLGAEHVPVDPGRRAVPVSASRLRADLAATGSTWSTRRRRRWPPGSWWPAPSRPAPPPWRPCWPCTTGRAAGRGAGPGA